MNLFESKSLNNFACHQNTKIFPFKLGKTKLKKSTFDHWKNLKFVQNHPQHHQIFTHIKNLNSTPEKRDEQSSQFDTPKRPRIRPKPSILDIHKFSDEFQSITRGRLRHCFVENENTTDWSASGESRGGKSALERRPLKRHTWTHAHISNTLRTTINKLKMACWKAGINQNLARSERRCCSNVC